MLRKPSDVNGFAPLRRIHSDICLSSDGQTFMFGTGYPGSVERYAAAVDKPGDLRQIVDLPGAEVIAGRFFPTGGRVLALIRDPDSSRRLVETRLSAPANVKELCRLGDAGLAIGKDPFAPGGDVVVFSATGVGQAHSGVALLNLRSGVLRRLEVRSLSLSPGLWAPDGRHLSLTAEQPDGLKRLMILDSSTFELLDTPAADHRDPNLSPGPWLSPTELLFLANGDDDNVGLHTFQLTNRTASRLWGAPWDVEDVAYRPSGNLWWVVNADGYSCLHERRLSNWHAHRPPVSLPGTLDGLCVSPCGTWAVARLQTPTRPESVVRVRLDGSGDTDTLVDNGPVASGVRLVEPVRVAVPLPEGRMTTAMLYRPADSTVFPVVVVLHGGPEYQERPRYTHRGLCQWLANEGVGVLVPNIGGSTGYGMANQLRVRHDWGGRDLEDVRAIHAFLSASAWADSSSLGLYGPSYGGYLAMWAIGRDPEKWKCAVSVSGPVNLISFCRAVPERLRDQVLPSRERDTREDMTFLLERSPVSVSDSITAPLLLVHGRRDTWAPLDDAKRLVSTLRGRGVDARLFPVPDEGHDLSGPLVDRTLEVVGAFLTEFLLTVGVRQ